MHEIKSNNELEVGKYYHCFDNLTGHHSIQKCYRDCDGCFKYIGRNTIWADDSNNQALNRWRMFEVEIPRIFTIYLCNKHHGAGFQSDCAICKTNNNQKQGK